MSTPLFPSCSYHIWVFLSSEMMWPVTTLSREKLCAHTAIRGWRRGLGAVHRTHLPVHTTYLPRHQWSPMPAHASTLPSKEQQKGRNHLKWAASPRKGASPNTGPGSRRAKCPSPPFKPLLPRCFFPEKTSPCCTRVAALHTEKTAVRINLTHIKHFALSLLGNSSVRFGRTSQIKQMKEMSCCSRSYNTGGCHWKCWVILQKSATNTTLKKYVIIFDPSL